MPAVEEKCKLPSLAKPIWETPHVTPSAELRGIRILVVDDDSDARLVVQRLLTASAAQISEAASAAEALATIDQFRPHVLITDIGMPELDGYDFIRELRARGYSPEPLPAIALTAYAYSGDRERAMLVGFLVLVVLLVFFVVLFFFVVVLVVC